MRQDPIDYIARTRAQYGALGYPPYAWVEEPDPPPFVRPSGGASGWRVGVVASGGIYALGQPAFHWKDDLSFRAIETSTPREALRITHFAYDLTDAREDPNVVLPLDPLRRLVATGAIASLGPFAYTFMGGIYSSRRVRDVLAPAIADRLQHDEIDVALLVPV
ncbi:MAG: glycine/sarcosine/betaine reductase selenoprotein B family protein [Myxococcota bacterium]